MGIKEHIIKECISICKREDVHKEFINMMKPLIYRLLEEIYPYVFISMTLVILCFVLLLGIFIILIHNSIYKKI